MPVDLGDQLKVVFLGWHVPDEDIFDSLDNLPGGLPVRERKRMTNSARPVVEMWDSKSYVIQPGDTEYWPAELCFKAFGDPRSSSAVRTTRTPKGTVGFIPDRPTEVRRLRLLYGNMAGGEEEVYAYPIVELYTLQDERITTVLEDPKALTTTPASETLSERDQLLDMITRQQAQIDRLAKVVGMQRPLRDEAELPSPDEDELAEEEYDSDIDANSDPRGELVYDESDTGDRGGR